MRFNYLKTAIRNFWNNKSITIINILGLSVGISSALIIYLIVLYDFSFDRFEPGRDRVYRIVSDGPNWQNAGVPAPLHEAIQRELPGVEEMAAFFKYNDWNVKVSVPTGNDKAPRVFKKQHKIAFADGRYFGLFPHQWLAGNATASLQDPFQLVLSESRAKVWFPGIPLSEMIGKTVFFDDTIQTTVSGIVQDLKANSDFDNQAIISLPTIPHSGLKPYYNWDDWGSVNSISQVVVRLGPGVLPGTIQRQITAIANKNDKTQSGPERTHYRLQPLSDIHFNAAYEGMVNKSVLRNLILLAGFLLLLGAINFINLSTAQAARRAKEIGIRKTLGSSKTQLIFQFLQETFLLTVMTTIVSMLITPLLLNVFSGFIPDGLSLEGIWQPSMLVFLALLIVVVSFLAGFYPAVVLSRFKPVLVLKGQASRQAGTTSGVLLRKTLTVSQFVIAQVLIIATLIVNKQIHFSLQKDMGFRKDAIVNFYTPFDFLKPGNEKFMLLNKLRAIPGIEAASIGNQAPAINGTMTTVVNFMNGKKELKIFPDTRSGDTAFISLYHIQLLAGRNVLPTDTATEVLINETMARQMGFSHPADALAKSVQFNGSHMPVVGIMADFNLAPVRTAIHPMIFYSEPRYGYVMHVALQPPLADWSKTLAKMQVAWKSVYPDLDFDYSFLDKSIEGFYQEDQHLSKLLSWSAGVAIFISCLGLLGLVIFTSNQRTREIGIRKVLGASVLQIISLLSKEFVALVSLAFLIAVPIAWWALYQWLKDFAYHTSLSWWVFLVSGVAMLVLSLIILSIRAGKAALANPVKSLRSE
jgi:putative ABC transport system permease protein